VAYADLEKQRAFQREWARKRRARQAEVKARLKASGCVACGEQEPCCLDFHHTDPSAKTFGIGSQSYGSMLTPETIEREATKCIVLCANCHRKLHAGLITVGGG
jgi:hypothetical protein